MTITTLNTASVKPARRGFLSGFGKITLSASAVALLAGHDRLALVGTASAQTACTSGGRSAHGPRPAHVAATTTAAARSTWTVAAVVVRRSATHTATGITRNATGAPSSSQKVRP